MFKLLVSDIDGTLLKKGEKYISDDIIESLEKLNRQGILIAFASGRHYKEMLEITKGMDVYYISCDGACIIYNGSVIYKRVIDERALKMFDGKENVYFYKPFEIQRGSQNKNDVVKICVNSNVFYENPFGTYEVYRDKSFREWIKNNSGKGQAVEFLQKQKNICIKETVAIGDNYNDAGMIKRATQRFVMKNAPNSIKMISNNIVDNAKDALNKILGGK